MYECFECGNGIIERLPEKWNGIDEWVESFRCVKCGAEWQGESVARNPAYDTPADRAALALVALRLDAIRDKAAAAALAGGHVSEVKP